LGSLADILLGLLRAFDVFRELDDGGKVKCSFSPG
jgi:hypothetical protein